MKKTIYVVILCCITCSGLFSQTKEEKELIQKADDFIAINREKWSDLEKRISATPDTATQSRIQLFNSHPFMVAFHQFTQANASQYAAVRAVGFAQYAPPPAALKTLPWHSPDALTSGNADLEVMSLSFIRSFEPAVAAEIVYSMVMPSMTAEIAAPIDEVGRIYRKKELYGFRLYTQPSGNNNWQLWVANRSFAINFHFNIQNGLLSNIQYTTPGNPTLDTITWPANLVKPMNESARLIADMMEVLWNSYPGKGYDPDNYAEYRASRNETLRNFYNQNQQRFIAAREQQLKALTTPATELQGYRELTKPDDQILHNTDTSYAISAYIHPQQWEINIEIAAGYYFEFSSEDIAKRVQHNALFGATRYARSLGNNEWEVWMISDVNAISYVWNIATGHIKTLRYWTK